LLGAIKYSECLRPHRISVLLSAAEEEEVETETETMDGLAAADTITITIALVSDVAAAGEEEVEARIITAVFGVIPALGVSSTEAGPVVEAAVGVVGVATFSATAIPNHSTLLSIFLYKKSATFTTTIITTTISTPATTPHQHQPTKQITARGTQ
jgi:hypothetical protein